MRHKSYKRRVGHTHDKQTDGWLTVVHLVTKYDIRLLVERFDVKL